MGFLIRFAGIVWLVTSCIVWAETNNPTQQAFIDKIRSAAERGEAEAQLLLGVMYDTGDGVPVDDSEGAKWYRKAAEQGHAEAQYHLGVMYAKGEGVPEDYVQAYFWINVAGVSYEKAREGRDLIRPLMTPQQISEAQALSTKYFEQRK